MKKTPDQNQIQDQQPQLDESSRVVGWREFLTASVGVGVGAAVLAGVGSALAADILKSKSILEMVPHPTKGDGNER